MDIPSLLTEMMLTQKENYGSFSKFPLTVKISTSYICVFIYICLHLRTMLNNWHSTIHRLEVLRRRFLLPTGLPHDNGTGPDLSRSSFYF